MMEQHRVPVEGGQGKTTVADSPALESDFRHHPPPDQLRLFASFFRLLSARLRKSKSGIAVLGCRLFPNE